MASELLKADYGEDDDDGEEESSLSAEERQGEISNLMVFDKELAHEGVREEITAIAEMNNERVRGNVMSVELAIQRELEYRTKIDMLKLRLLYDLEETVPIVVQGAPSNFELGEMNIKSPSDNILCSQGEISDLMFFERKLAPDEVWEEIALGQTTNERVTRKIMSVELAIQRELEYQAKFKNLQWRPHNEFQEAPMLIEGAPSDLELEKMNRKSHSDNSSLPGRISDPMFFKRELESERSQGEITTREIIDERVGRNIMPVELAIQRELAYQRKLESLQCQPSIKFQEPPIPFQGSSSNLRIVGVKREAPSGNLTCLLPRKVQQPYCKQNPETQSVKTFCKYCQVVCSNEFFLKAHFEGRRHKARLKLLKNQNKNGKEVVCNVCLISCSDKQSFKQHLAGKKHAACVQAKALKKSQWRS